MAKVFNFIAFQAVWLACVLSASRGLVWPGLMAGGLFALVTIVAGRSRSADLQLVAWAVVLGGLLDSLWAWLGWMDYAAAPWGFWAPPWILGLWLGFAMTINHSLAWLRFKPVILAGLAAVACPFSYYAGHRLGALEWQYTPGLLVVTPLSWAGLLAWLSYTNRHTLERGGEHVTTVA